MKVVLVQPKIGYMDALRSAPSPPLGLLSAAARLCEEFEVELIDARLVPDLAKALERAITNDTLFVGLTCHTGPMIDSALHISRTVKRLADVPVVWGGVHASLAPEQTAQHPLVDICVIGEGEETALDLARALVARAPLDSVPGIAFGRDGVAVRTGARELIAAGRWPEPAYHLVDMSNYLPEYSGRPSLFYQASRGCPFRCGYCYNPPFNRGRYRKQPPGLVIDNLGWLRERIAFEDVYFVDDNFCVDHRWTEQIGRGVSKLGMTWQMQGIDVTNLLKIDSALIGRLRDLGCRRVTIGVETGSDRIRRRIHKNGTREDVIRAIGRLEGSGLLAFTSFMVGFPGETLVEMRETVDLALELLDRYDYVRCSPFYCYTPSPGTGCYQDALDEGFEAPKDLEGWARVGSWDRFSWERRDGDRILGRSFFEGLNMATLFLDHKTREYSASRLVGLLADLYRPVARFRARRLFFDLMPERRLLDRFYDRLTAGG